MSWYSFIKTSSFVDSVFWEVKGKDNLKLWIGGKPYRYFGIDGLSIADFIDRLKKSKNKFLAGQKMQQLIRSLEKNKEEKNELV